MSKVIQIIGPDMAQRRKALGLSQEEVAGQAGLSQSYLAALENANRTNPTLDTLEQIAAVLKAGLEVRFVPLPDEVSRIHTDGDTASLPWSLDPPRPEQWAEV